MQLRVLRDTLGLALQRKGLRLASTNQIKTGRRNWTVATHQTGLRRYIPMGLKAEMAAESTEVVVLECLARNP